MRLGREVAIACLLLAPALVAAESGTVVRASQLLAQPYSDAQSRGVIRGETGVEIVERQGGWYHVEAEDGRRGWLRLSSIRLGEAAAEEEDGFWASLFSFTGRSEARTASATTGIRGLSETDIRDAVPDAAAVKRLDGFAADDREARHFAAQIGLAARDVPPLSEGVSDQQGGRP